MNKGKLIVVVVIVAAVAVIGGVFGIREFMRSQAVAPFNARVGEYLAATKPSSAPPSVKGKVVVIDKEGLKVDRSVYFDLPEDMRAATPEEVGTIVVVLWKENIVDYYKKSESSNEKGLPAIQMSAEVTVVNKETMETMGQPTIFRGKEPPEKIKPNSGQNKGPRPTDQVVQFVKSLPRK